MRKLIAILFAVVLCCTLTGCAEWTKPAEPVSVVETAPPSSSAPAVATADATATALPPMTMLEKVKATGQLVVGTNAQYAPFEFHAEIDGADTVVGMDMALAKCIADKLGAKLIVQDQAFDKLLGELAANRVDLVIAALADKPERRKIIDFTDEYFQETMVIAIRTPDQKKYVTLWSLEGKTVGVIGGQPAVDKAAKLIPGALIVDSPSLLMLLNGLLRKDLDAVILQEDLVDEWLKEMPNLHIMKMKARYEMGGMFIAVAKGNEDAVKQINAWIAEWNENGKMLEMYLDSLAQSELAILK